MGFAPKRTRTRLNNGDSKEYNSLEQLYKDSYTLEYKYYALLEMSTENLNEEEIGTRKMLWDQYPDRIPNRFIRTTKQRNNLTQDQIGKIWEMYCQINHDIDRNNKSTVEYRSIPYLDIDLPFKEIEEVFKKNKVIQIRKLKGNALFIGGGPSVQAKYKGSPLINYDVDSLDPSMCMNANIMAKFGDDDLTKIIPEKYYTKILMQCICNTCSSIVDWKINWMEKKKRSDEFFGRTTSNELVRKNILFFINHAVKETSSPFSFYNFFIQEKVILTVDYNKT